MTKITGRLFVRSENDTEYRSWNDLTEEEKKNIIEMPEVTGLSFSEVKKILQEAGLDYKIEGEAGNDTIIIDQLPKKGIKVEEGTEVNGNGCLNDCKMTKWVGNSSSWNSGCKKTYYYNAHWRTSY